MSKNFQKGYINVLVILVLVIGIIAGVYLVQKTTNILPKASEEKEANISVNLEGYASNYLNSARKNFRWYPDGRRMIIPSKAYDDGMYLRDAFFATVGLEDISLIQDCFSFFEQTQDENGQVRFAVAINPEKADFGFKDDESNLIYIIWAGILNRRGISLNQDKIEKSYLFVKTRVQDGWFISTTGDYRYWADTYDNKQNDTITYNQGFYALSLRFLKELRPDLVSGEEVSQAENNYKSLFKDTGSLPLSKNTKYQDASSLFPEFLARFYFNQGILPDNQVIASVDKLINLASVYDSERNLQGIKTIYDTEGSFLPYGAFKPPMNNGGVYQNGAYWPLYIITDLSLAYKISGDDKYKYLTTKLAEKELSSDGKSKEFLYLEPRRIGAADSERADYSWNALITIALKWSGMNK